MKIASPWQWQTHAVLASTQDAAIEAARAGQTGRLAILAASQTAGRGRAGRAWIAPEGNLNLSVMLRRSRHAMQPGRWALVAGLALQSALSPHAAGILLKWPNDVLLDGAKLGGILIDSQMGQGGLFDWIVIGFGANLAQAPAIAGRRTGHLVGSAPMPRMIAESVVASLDDWASADMEDIRDAWLARAHPVGTMLNVQTPSAHLKGAFAGLAPGGELLLSGRGEPISSAEIGLC